MSQHNKQQSANNNQMTDQQPIVERLSQFNNMSFTKKQWEIILKGCGCPKSSHFWTALRQNNLVKYKRIYTLVDMDIHSYAIILDQYCTANRASVKKSYDKAKERKKAQEKNKAFKGITFYMVGGVLTTEKPERDL